jgi:hypothetical protein
MTVLDGHAVLAILADYLDGVAPPIPVVELSVQGHPEEQLDERAGVSSWTCSMNGRDLGTLYTEHGKKLFARNIRGFLGLTSKVNKDMVQTLKKEPESFWYLNNGVTLVCDQARYESAGGNERLTLWNPQVINGQQTTRVLESLPKQASKARVAVRVIEVSRDAADRDFAVYDDMVARIVKATNSQNEIKASDLRSNDRLQVTLEREFQKLGYRYERKRAAASERAALRNQYEWRLSKDGLAIAVTGCHSATRGRSLGREALFGDEYYKGIFDRSPKYLLCCWRLSELVDGLAWGDGERQWAKFVVLHFLWTDLSDAILARREVFLDVVERWQEDRRYALLERAAKHAFAGALRHYRAERGTGSDRLELSPFFKRQQVYEQFERFWRSRKNPAKPKYTKAAGAFRAGLQEN